MKYNFRTKLFKRQTSNYSVAITRQRLERKRMRPGLEEIENSLRKRKSKAEVP